MFLLLLFFLFLGRENKWWFLWMLVRFTKFFRSLCNIIVHEIVSSECKNVENWESQQPKKRWQNDDEMRWCDHLFHVLLVLLICSYCRHWFEHYLILSDNICWHHSCVKRWVHFSFSSKQKIVNLKRKSHERLLKWYRV